MNRHFDFPFQTRVSETEITKICTAPLLGDKPGCFSHPETSCNTDTWRGGSLDNPGCFPVFGALVQRVHHLLKIVPGGVWCLWFNLLITKYHIELSTSGTSLNFQNVHHLQPFSGFRSCPPTVQPTWLVPQRCWTFHVFNNSLDISNWKMLWKQKC